MSGSRKPAEAGALVGLLAGDPEAVAEVRPLLTPMCRETIVCGGRAGDGLTMKLAVNLYLNSMLAALAEAVHFAERSGLDLEAFRHAIDSGQLASDLTRVKIPKLIGRDFAVQAATSDAYTSTRLIADEARAVGVATPMLDLSSELYGESLALGNDREDMVAIIEAIEARTRSASEVTAAR